MPTPRLGYRLADGTRVPSVSTIIGRFKDSGALLKWAYSQGRTHGFLEGTGKPAPASLYEVSGKAADIGTAAHAMVEAIIAGEEPEARPEYLSLDVDDRIKAANAFAMYQQWAAQSKLRIVAQEMQLVSEVHRYGGTPDAIGEIDGELCLVDWKTSNSVYSDYLLQLAAYRALWEEVHPEQPLAGGFHLCRFAKEYGDFAHHYYRELDDALEMFLLLRRSYGIDQRLRKRAA
jgi:hypothetical protein